MGRGTMQSKQKTTIARKKYFCLAQIQLLMEGAEDHAPGWYQKVQPTESFLEGHSVLVCFLLLETLRLGTKGVIWLTCLDHSPSLRKTGAKARAIHGLPAYLLDQVQQSFLYHPRLSVQGHHPLYHITSHPLTSNEST